MPASVSFQKLFTEARSQNGWSDRTVSDDQVRQIYDLMKWGPTSLNSSPARIVIVRSSAAKAMLKEALSPGNVDKAMTAPVIVIIGHDLLFYEKLPELFPHNPAVKALFEGESKASFAEATAFRNGTLQGAYFMIAARALGLDCGPMSGFDNAKVDAAFFPDGSVKSNFICGIGYGDESKLFARSPRLAFDQVCSVR
jgi:3-hydroxypropanoate dehydrogenase